MSDRELIELLRSWYERPFAVQVEPCENGPPFGAIVRWVESGAGLGPEEIAHVEQCPRCRAAVRAARAATTAPPIRLTVGPAQPKERTTIGERVRPALRNSRVRRWALGLGGLAAAAAIVLVFVSIFFHRTAAASAMDVREIAYAPPLVMVSLWSDPADEAARQAAEDAIAEARLELEQALTLGDRAVVQPLHSVGWLTSRGGDDNQLGFLYRLR